MSSSGVKGHIPQAFKVELALKTPQLEDGVRSAVETSFDEYVGSRSWMPYSNPHSRAAAFLSGFTPGRKAEWAVVDGSKGSRVGWEIRNAAEGATNVLKALARGDLPGATESLVNAAIQVEGPRVLSLLEKRLPVTVALWREFQLPPASTKPERPAYEGASTRDLQLAQALAQRNLQQAREAIEATPTLEDDRSWALSGKRAKDVFAERKAIAEQRLPNLEDFIAAIAALLARRSPALAQTVSDAKQALGIVDEATLRQGFTVTGKATISLYSGEYPDLRATVVDAAPGVAVTVSIQEMAVGGSTRRHAILSTAQGTMAPIAFSSIGVQHIFDS